MASPRGGIPTAMLLLMLQSPWHEVCQVMDQSLCHNLEEIKGILIAISEDIYIPWDINSKWLFVLNTKSSISEPFLCARNVEDVVKSVIRTSLLMPKWYQQPVLLCAGYAWGTSLMLTCGIFTIMLAKCCSSPTSVDRETKAERLITCQRWCIGCQDLNASSLAPKPSQRAYQ